MKLVLSLLK